MYGFVLRDFFEDSGELMFMYLQVQELELLVQQEHLWKARKQKHGSSCLEE